MLSLFLVELCTSDNWPITNRWLWCNTWRHDTTGRCVIIESTVGNLAYVDVKLVQTSITVIWYCSVNGNPQKVRPADNFKVLAPFRQLLILLAVSYTGWHLCWSTVKSLNSSFCRAVRRLASVSSTLTFVRSTPDPTIGRPSSSMLETKQEKKNLRIAVLFRFDYLCFFLCKI